MTIDWPLIVSLFANLIILFQWRQATQKAKVAVRNEIMQTALSAKESAYAVRAALIFFMEQFGTRIEQPRLDALNRSLHGLGEHVTSIEGLYEIASTSKDCNDDELDVMRTSILRVLSDVKDMSALLNEARRHHEHA